MTTILLLVCALLCFILATIGVGGRVNVLALGFVFLTAAQLIPLVVGR
jgi:hypothetical protein